MGTLQTGLLVLHLLGATVSLGLVIFSMGVMYKNLLPLYRSAVVGIALTGAIQLVTGSLLALVSEGDVVSFCSKIGLYLSVMVLVEIALVFKMSKEDLICPWKPLKASSLVGFASVVITVISLSINI